MKGPQPQNSAVETYFHQPSRSAVLPFHQTKSFRFCFIGNESDACHRGSRHLKPFALSCGKGSVDKASADFSTATSLLKGQGKRERPNRPTNLNFREAQGLCTFDPSHAKAPVSAYLDLPTWTSERRRASVNSTLRTPRRQGAPTSTYPLGLGPRHRASVNSTFRTPRCQGAPTWTCQLRPPRGTRPL